MRLINLTPHAIVLRGDNGDTVVPPSGMIARVASTPGVLVTIPEISIPVAAPTVYGEITGLPAPTQIGCEVCGGYGACHLCEEPKIFIVSAIVGETMKVRGWHRPDVMGPGTGPNDGAIRNGKGQVVAVTRLVQFTV